MDLGTLEQTILNFYAGDVAADEWLTQFQQSEDAWTMSIHLLASSRLEVQGFAANVLLQKCRVEARSLGEDSRDDLISTILSQAMTTDVESVQRTLYISAASAAVVECSDPTAFERHFAKPAVSSLPAAKLCAYLAALGEAFAERATRADYETAGEFCRIAVQGFASTAEIALGEVLDDLTTEILRGIGSWGTAGLSLSHLLESPLLDQILHWATSPQLTPGVTKALLECAENPVLPEHVSHLAERLVPALAALSSLYQSAVEADEYEWCANFVLMLAAVSRRLADALAACGGTSLQESVTAIFEILLHAIGSSSLSVSAEILTFWDYLSSIVSPDPFWSSLFARVLQMILERCQFEPAFSSWAESSIDEEEFRRYRRSAMGVMIALVGVLKEDTFSVITSPLTEAEGSVSWQTMEVSFFGATAVASEMVPRPVRAFRAAISSPLPDLEDSTERALVSFMELGFGDGAHELHPQVRCAALEFSGAYAHWLCCDSARLIRAIEVIVGNMEDPAVNESAAKAFQTMCSVSGKTIAAILDVNALIIQTTRCAFPTPAASTTGEALIRVIAHCPPSAAHECVKIMVTPILESLQQLYTQHTSATVDDVSLTSEIAKELNVLGRIIRFLDTLPVSEAKGHPAVEIFELFWETFEALKTAFLGSEAVLLELCTVFDSVIHSAKVMSLEVIPTVFQTLLVIMEQVIPEAHMIAPFTTSLEYHGQLAPSVSGIADASIRSEVLDYFGKALDLAFERLNLLAPDFARDSAAYGAYLDFGTRMVIFSPESVASSECLPHVLDFCIMCVESGSREALRSACPFLSRTLQSNHYDLFLRVQAWLEQNAARALVLLLHVICFVGPLDVILKPAELVFVIGQAVGFEHFPPMLTEVLQTDQFENVDEHSRLECLGALTGTVQVADGDAYAGKSEFVRTLVTFGKSCRL